MRPLLRKAPDKPARDAGIQQRATVRDGARGLDRLQPVTRFGHHLDVALMFQHHGKAAAQYLLPLAMLQWYLRCAGPVSDGERYAFSATLFALTLVMCIGIVTATMGMWLPRIV